MSAVKNGQVTPAFCDWLVKMLGLAAAYYVAGRLGLLLAIPPGYATAVWPPSGIALAGVLLFGYRVWPGILIGSFFINVWTSFDATDAFSVLRSVLLAVGIGAGASLQAVVGAFLIRRRVGFPNPLTKDVDIVKFLLLGGPIACLVAATVGVTTLLVGGVIQGHEYAFSWWTWWVGDTIGAVIVMPLALVVIGQPRDVWRRRRTSVALPLCVTFALAVVFFVYASSWEQHAMALGFEKRAQSFEQEIRRDFDGYLEVLYSVGNLYASSGDVDRQQFRTFVKRSLARYPGIMGLSWDRRVQTVERAAYEETARRDGHRDFQITERDASGRLVRAPNRDAYVSVSNIEPYQGNESALGFDVASDPTRREALNLARDTGKPAATSRVMLVQETGGRFGLLVFLPVYRLGLPHETPDERRQNLQGFATGVFRISDMLHSTRNALAQEDIELRLYDESAPENDRPLYASATGEWAPGSSVGREGGFGWVTRFEMAGRQWALHLRPGPAYLAAHRTWQPWAVLAAGLLFTGLLGAFLLVVTGRAALVEEVVAERTTELSLANDHLQQEVSERHRAEAEVRQLNAELDRRVQQRTADLETANKELEAFAYSVAHDLRAPLRAIDGFSQVLAGDYAAKLDEEGGRILEVIRSNVQTMGRLVDDLLEFSRLGRTEMKLSEVNMKQLAQDAFKELKLGNFDRQIVFELKELNSSLGDRSMLRQVLVNLLSNAMKFTRPREITSIEVGSRVEDGQATYYIKDNGVGFDMRYADKLFGVFERVHRAEEFEGTGVGLAIVQRIVHRHGGRVWAEGKVDEGATFYFTLPTRQENAA